MIIYGVALLAACMVAGTFVGDYLGVLLGVKANVGGVGIAMLLLVAASASTRLRHLVEGPSGDGIKFWGAMYIPIVVAMAARQNVVAAAHGGILAVAAGVIATVVCFALVPVLSRLSARGTQGQADSTDQQGVR